MKNLDFQSKNALVVSIEAGKFNSVCYANGEERNKGIMRAVEFMHMSTDIDSSRVVIFDDGRITMYHVDSKNKKKERIEEESKEGIDALSKAIDYLYTQGKNWRDYACSYHERHRYALVNIETQIVVKEDISPKWLDNWARKEYGEDYDRSAFEIRDTTYSSDRDLYGVHYSMCGGPEEKIAAVKELKAKGVHEDIIAGCFMLYIIKMSEL